MKKVIFGFTYAEILTVVLIIGLVSSFGMVSFFDFLKNKEIESRGYEIVNLIKTEDRKILNNEIFDYNIKFFNDIVVINENQFDLSNSITFKDNKIRLSSGLLTGESVKLMVMENKKLLTTIPLVNEVNLDIKKEYDYQIKGKIFSSSGEKNLNDIYIYNIDKEKDNINILKIISDKTESIDNIEIKNIGGNKGLYINGVLDNDIKSLKLIIEKDGKEKDFIIKL